MIFLRLLLLASLLFTTGCKEKEQIKVYRISKAEPESSASTESAGSRDPATMPRGQQGNEAMSGMTGLPANHPTVSQGILPESNTDSPAAPAFKWKTPSHWEQQPAASMRLASFSIKGKEGAFADVSVVVLGGAAGGILENVNRWLNQLGQPAIDEEKLKAMMRSIASGLGPIEVVDLQGLPAGGDPLKDGRILAGMASINDRTLFFKMRGNSALVESEKENFLQWLASTRQEPAPASVENVPSPGADSQAEQVAAKPKFQAPASWQPKPLSAMRFASFSASNSSGESADISAISFPGGTGGDLANVNRWRGQVGLDPVADAELPAQITRIDSKAGPIQVVDLQGPKARLMAGWISHAGNTWFFKISGPPILLDSEKANFLQWLKTIEFAP